MAAADHGHDGGGPNATQVHQLLGTRVFAGYCASIATVHGGSEAISSCSLARGTAGRTRAGLPASSTPCTANTFCRGAPIDRFFYCSYSKECGSSSPQTKTLGTKRNTASPWRWQPSSIGKPLWSGLMIDLTMPSSE